MTDDSKEDGAQSPSHRSPLFFDRFHAVRGVPLSDAIATGTVGPSAGCQGADANRDRPRPGRENSVASLPRCRHSIIANFWTAGGRPLFQRGLGAWLRETVPDWRTGAVACWEDLGVLLELVDWPSSKASMTSPPSSGRGLSLKALEQQRIIADFQTACGRVLS